MNVVSILFRYRFIFSILVLSLLPLISIFATQDLFHSHDGLVHLPRMAAFYKALQDGQFPVRYAGDLNYGYGMPLFNYIYQLPYLISSIFLFLGFSLVNSFKLTLSLSYVLSGIFMYLFAKSFFEDEMKALFVSIFYQFVPFRLVELLIRASFGEVFTYTFLPLVLYGIWSFLKTKRFSYFTLTSVATALLVLSHNSISLVFFGVAALFALFFARKKEFLLVGLALGLGLCLSVYYWAPAVLEHKYTYGDLHMRNLYLSHFPPFLQFFIPNFFNDSALQTEGISTQIGLFHVIALILGGYAIFTKKLKDKVLLLFLFCFSLFLIAFFFMSPLSKPFWALISFLRQFQFSWRFLSVVGFATSLLAVSYFLLPRIKKWAFLILGLVIISTVFYWTPSLGYDKIDENYYWNFPLNTTYFGETDLKWSAGAAREYPKKRVEIIAGEGEVYNLIKKSNLQTFEVIAKTDVTVVSKVQYFPGWRVYVDKKQVKDVQFQDPNWRGLITFPVPKGDHKVRLEFGESPVRAVADFLSVSSLVALTVVWAMYKRRSYGA